MFAKQSNNTENIIQYPVRDVNEKQTDKAKTTEESSAVLQMHGLFPLAPENCNLNNFVWVFLLILSGVFRLSVKYGLSRFLLSSCCHANNDIIHAIIVF